MVFFVVSFLLAASAEAMEQGSSPFYRAVASLAIAPSSVLLDRWESVESLCADTLRMNPPVRILLRAVHGVLAVRAAAQESPSCALDCQHQFCFRSYGCATVPLSALALVGFYADLPYLTKVSLGTVGSLGALCASFISLAHCARDYFSGDDEFTSTELRTVMMSIKRLLDESAAPDRV